MTHTTGAVKTGATSTIITGIADSQRVEPGIMDTLPARDATGRHAHGETIGTDGGAIG